MSKTIQPKILKDYSIIKELGSGAYGYVWEVKCKLTQKKYALKKIFDAFRNQVDAQRTYRQVQFLSKIDNQFIIKPQRFFPSKNKKDLFILFEFMEADLQIANHLNVLQKNHLIFAFYQILLGLDHLHDRNLIHRDLKPSNILINDSSKIKICDFGLIRSHKDKEIQQTVLTDEIATKWYRAPQVLLGSKRYSNKIDIWSFGCIVSELLTKKVAFPGNTTFDQFQLMLQFNGPLSQTDKQSLKLQSTQNLQKLISPISQKLFQTYFSQVSKQFYPLIRNTLQINPKKRMSTKQLLKLPLFDQFRKNQFETVCQQIPFQFELNDNKMFQICQYRQKIQEISTTFNSKKQTELRLYQEQKIEYQQKNKENKKIQQANKQRKQIKRNSKSLNQDEKNNKKAVTQSKNFSVQGVIRSKKVITMPKIKSLQKKHQSLQNNRKSFQQFKGNSFTFGKQSTNNKSTPYLNHQKLVKKPIKNMGFPFKSIQNRTDTLMKKSFHNCFSNQTKMFFSQQNQQPDLKGEPIYRNNAYTKHDQKRQLYIYSNWITQSIYGKQNKPKKY